MDVQFETVCQGCDTQCRGCTIEGKEPICSDALDHSSSAGVNATIEFLSIDPGYWRATNTSTDVLACYSGKACVGGVTGRKEYCHTGYEGPCKYGDHCSV